MPDPAALTGPLAALAGAIVIIAGLWREHVKADADVRSQRDAALAVSAAQVAATNRLADVIEERDRLAAARGRQGDS